MFKRQIFPEVIMLTDKEKDTLARKIDPIKDLVWHLMEDCSETQLNHIQNTGLKNPGPITDLYVIYRQLVEVQAKFDSK